MTFWGQGFQGTHMDALGQFSSKLMTLTSREGLWIFLANLALCVPLTNFLCFCLKVGGNKEPSFLTIRLCKIIFSNCWFYFLLTGKERHQDWSVQRFWLYSFCQLRSSNEGASSETHDRWPLVWCKNPQFKGKNAKFYTALHKIF